MRERPLCNEISRWIRVLVISGHAPALRIEISYRRDLDALSKLATASRAQPSSRRCRLSRADEKPSRCPSTPSGPTNDVI